MSDACFFSIRLDIEGEKLLSDVSQSVLENNIQHSLKKLFGEVGAAVPFSILRFDPTNLTSIIQCPSDYLVKLRSALCLESKFQGERCCYVTLKVSHSLLNL